MQAGHLDIVYTPDPENPADYLSKFVPATKATTSARYSAGRAVPAAGLLAAVAATAVAATIILESSSAEAHDAPAPVRRDRPVRNPALRLRGSGGWVS